LDTLDKSSDPTDTLGDVPHVRGGMCWYGNILLIAGDFGDHHQVNPPLTLLNQGSTLSPQCFQHDFKLVASQRILPFVHPFDVIDCRFTTRLLSRQYVISFFSCPLHRIRGSLYPSKTCSIRTDQLQGNHSFTDSSSCHLMDLTRGPYKYIPFRNPLTKELGDPSEDAAVATVVFLLDGKLVLLRPSPRSQAPGTDLKYDMRILGDKLEFFMLLPNRVDDSPISTLNGSLWAWDGKSLKVIAFGRLCSS
jgi:hypothetical protein